MPRYEIRAGSKTISTASAWPGWWPYVGFSFSPPAYPTRVEMTPSRLRSSSWTPQKQPAARIAVSVLSVMTCPLSTFRSLASAEGDDVRAHARIEERDLEGERADAPMLADELVHPRTVDGAFADLVDVEAVGVTGGFAVEEHREPDRGPRGRRREDQIEIACLEAERDRPVRGVEHGRLLLDGPLAR